MVESASPFVSPESSPRASFESVSPSTRPSSPSTDSLRPSFESNRAGYSSSPGPHRHGSTLSQLFARAGNRLRRNEGPEEEDRDNPAVLGRYDTNEGFAMMQSTQNITQTLGSVTQDAGQFANTVNSTAQQLMGIISTALR